MEWRTVGSEQKAFVYRLIYADGIDLSVTAFDFECLEALHAYVKNLEHHMRSVNIT